MIRDGRLDPNYGSQTREEDELYGEEYNPFKDSDLDQVEAADEKTRKREEKEEKNYKKEEEKRKTRRKRGGRRKRRKRKTRKN